MHKEVQGKSTQNGHKTCNRSPARVGSEPYMKISFSNIPNWNRARGLAEKCKNKIEVTTVSQQKPLPIISCQQTATRQIRQPVQIMVYAVHRCTNMIAELHAGSQKRTNTMIEQGTDASATSPKTGFKNLQ